MLEKIIRFSVNNKLIIGLLVVALVGWGVLEVTRLPIDAVPDITDNQVQIITTSPALGAPDVERFITFPIEQANSNLPGLKEIRSISRFGLSVVTIVFHDDVNIYLARQQVTERLQEAQEKIPRNLGLPKLAPVTTGLGEIYQYVVRPKAGYENRYDAMALRTLQDWVVRRQLLGVKGVAEVSSFGGYLRQYEVAVDPGQLHANNVTITDIFNALERNNENAGGAYIERGPTALYIRTEGLVKDSADIASIVVKTVNGFPLLIRDVARVQFGSATRFGAMTYNGEREVAGAVVMMLKGANSNEVIKAIRGRIEQIQKTLPEGVVIEPFLDRTKMVNSAIGTVEKNLLEGALIVVFVLVVFLGNMRAGLLVASVIPLSMLFAIILMNLFGVSGNLMSLGALDFGLIVDGAVIIVEAVMHRLAQSKDFANVSVLSRKQMNDEVQTSASRMMNSAVFGQIIILIVYLPIFTLEGIEGKMFKPMAQTVAFALAGAFLLSLTYIPMMSSLLLSRKLSHKETWSDKMMHRVENTYSKVLAKSLEYGKMIIALSVAMLVGALVLAGRLGGEFIPSLEEGDFAVETRLLAGANLQSSIDVVSRASRILRQRYPEVIKVVGKTGSSEVPTDPMPIDASDLIVVLKGKKEWTSAKTFSELADKMTKDLEEIPGIKFGFQYPVQMRFNELMTGARQDVVCKIFGANMDTLARLAQHLGSIAGTVNGAKDVYVEAVNGMPQVVIQYDRQAIARFGINIADVNRIVNAAFAGQVAGQVFEDESRFDLVVRMTGERRKDLSDVQNLLIPTPNGIQIPLSQVASIEVTEGPNQIQREDAHRRIIVGFNVRGRDVQSVVQELQQKVDKGMKMPSGYYTTYGGAFENLQAAKSRLAIAVPISLLLIFLMLYFAFGSVRQGLLIYSAVPLSAVGGIVALVVRDLPFSISAGVGFIALFGVAVLNGIVLITEFNRLHAGGLTDIHEVILQGTRNRIRPVLMTAFVASLGFLPMAVSNGAGAGVQRPLASVVIGGLLIATLLTLFVLPALYLMFEKRAYMQPKNIAALLLLLLLPAAGKVMAQTPITLAEAETAALQYNPELRVARMQADRDKRNIATSADIAPANVTAEYGHVNSFFTDTKLGASQSIGFPTVYSSQKRLLRTEWEAALLTVAMREQDIRKQVAETFYALLYLKEKKKLLMESDSLYAEFLEKAALRLEKGETSVLEKAAAGAQREQIRLQLDQLQEDVATQQIRLGYLLGANKNYEPTSASPRARLNVRLDTFAVAELPASRWMQQQIVKAGAVTKNEQAKLLPGLTVGMYRQTFVGYQLVDGAERYFGNNQFFGSVMAGITLPIFSAGQYQRVRVAKLDETIARTKYDANRQLLTSKRAAASNAYNRYLRAVQYYEATGLQNAATITTAANAQYRGGYINYMEWVLLINQAIAIRNEYTEALRQLNDATLTLNYFTN